ncbi:hypothetical protein KC669_03635 [Candidatus Dojkabacteria bacterium]|uniref:Uncharacterized protein n=1 Tax=Candidatus Dojkabacteria bacterium TaxID=2099670 RepID=A0A955RLI1_9BACT|nr:hypothetical protein [Candidatus Dojkabacteria bacterium]
MKKIIVINGPATSGKNTFIKAVRAMLKEADILVYSFSSIFPIKDELFKTGQWDGKTKGETERNLMIDLKAKMIKDGDKPLKYLVSQINSKSEGIFFVHIREKDEIEKFIETCKINLDITPFTLHYDRLAKDNLNTTAEIYTREYNNYDFDIIAGEGLNSVKAAAIDVIRKVGINELSTTTSDDEINNAIFHKEFDDELSAGYA